MKCASPKLDGVDLWRCLQLMGSGDELTAEDVVEVVLVNPVSELTTEGKEAS